MSFETLDEAPAQPQIRCIQLVQDSITFESSNVATTPLASPYPCVIIEPDVGSRSPLPAFDVHQQNLARPSTLPNHTVSTKFSHYVNYLPMH